MNIHSVYGFFQRRFRPQRIEALKLQVPSLGHEGSTVLDVGGVASWWKEVQPATRDITIVNLDTRHESSCREAGFRFLSADGRALPFKDGEFDLVHSNSVIEHVGSLEDQRRFASEVRRCGKSIYLQTPNRWFLVEPHLITLFVHWLPHAVQRRLIRWASVWGLVSRPTQQQIDAFLRDTRLLTRREVEELFPDCDLQRERVFGLTKSFVVVRR